MAAAVVPVGSLAPRLTQPDSLMIPQTLALHHKHRMTGEMGLKAPLSEGIHERKRKAKAPSLPLMNHSHFRVASPDTPFHSEAGMRLRKEARREQLQ